MKLQTLALLSVLAFNCSYAQVEQVQMDQAAKQLKEYKEYLKKNELPGLTLAQEKFGSTAPGLKPKSIDEIEAQAVELKQEAKRKEEKSQDLENKSQKLAKKSDKLEKKAQGLDQEAGQLAEASKQNLADSKNLNDQVENYEYKAQREQALHDICQKKIQKAKIFKIFDRRSEQQQIEKCVSDYKESKLDKKEKIKQAYLGKQCTFNPGVSIECPEGTYKFESANPVASVNAAERQDQKDPQVGEQQSQQDYPGTADDDVDATKVIQK